MNSTTELILLVEDDPNDILLFEKALSTKNFPIELVVVQDGEKAIAYFGDCGEDEAHNIPDMVLLDLKLPRKSGFEVLEWIKNHPKYSNIPVIIFSSSNQTKDLQTAYSLGANSYLVKPTGFAELNKLIEALGGYWFIHNQIIKTK
jgi:CheY-like chemotaxis protein